MTKSEMIYNTTVSYLERIWSREAMDKKIADAEATLKDVDFDTIVCTGLSGTLFGLTLAHRMNKMLLIVRKRGAHTHSAYPVEGQLGQRWLFVDDLVDSGVTRLTVIKAVAEIVPPYNEVKFVGQYMYCYDTFNEPLANDDWDTALKSAQDRRRSVYISVEYEHV